jgi:hypothetical protein
MSRTVPSPKRSASFYRKNAKARAKKAAYDKAFNARPEQKKDRAGVALLASLNDESVRNWSEEQWGVFEASQRALECN